jgi:hypothetical protein
MKPFDSHAVDILKRLSFIVVQDYRMDLSVPGLIEFVDSSNGVEQSWL